MKITVLALSLLFVTVSVFGQTKIEKLPSFYDQSEGNKVFSVDMVSNTVEPIVLYTTYNHNDVKSKMWDGQEWVSFGVFPAVKNRGQVNIELYNGNAYALVQSGEGWTLYEKKKNSESWTVFGNSNFAGTKEFSHPTLTFIEGNPVVYERHYREEKVDMYKYQNGKFYNLAGINKLTGMKSDFVMVSDEDDKMLMAWTSFEKENFQLFEINKEGDETTQKTITKGLKVKNVQEIQDLFYHKGHLYMYYTNASHDLKAAEYDHDNAKWEMIEMNETMGELGFYKANDLSIVSKSRENDLPVFYKYNGKNWNTGIEIGTEKIYQGQTVKLVEALGEYYLLNYNNNGGTIVQKITID